MLFETKLFLFCLSITLLPEAVHLTTEIEVVSCNKTNISAKVKRNGFYYLSTGKTSKLLNTNDKAPFKITFAQPTSGNAATIIRVDTQNMLSKGYDVYSVTCKSVVKTVVTMTLSVNRGTTPKPVTVSVNTDVSGKFYTTKNSKKTEVKAVTLGEKVTMSINAKTIFQKINVQKCQVSDGSKTGQWFLIYSPNRKTIMKLTSSANPATLEFEAFQLISSKRNTIVFKCNVTLCMEKTCSTPAPNNPGPVLLEAARGVKHVNFDSILTVYLPPRQMISHAVKVTSYTKGALLTLAAILLRHQLG